MADTRIERDSMGEMSVPADAYWGAQTQRAVENFPISGYRFGRRFIRAMGLIKRAAARTNVALDRLDAGLGKLIEQAADEVIEGKLDRHFVLDIFQTGSGTSTNMNANEVIANRAIELAGGKIGSRDPVHPNDHVNTGQSSNDVIPTALHVSMAEALHQDLIPALELLANKLEIKAKSFDKIVKIGRTHLQDATPIRLGQEFSGYAAQTRLSILRCNKAIRALRELATVGEAFAALDAGADALKLFPAEGLPPAVVKAWRAVLPKDLWLLPVGGITPARMAAYIDAGANGFGLGSALYRPGLTAVAVGERATTFAAAWAALSASPGGS